MIQRITTIIALLFFVACSATPIPPSQESFLEEKLLTENDFRLAARRYLENGGGPIVSTYDVALFDLNGDHTPEGLVMMNTPFNTWCHLAGCALLIFEIRGNDIVLNSRIEPVRGPLFIHDTGGTWKSIVSRQYGIDREARYIELKNNGNGYPAFALNAPDYHGQTLPSRHGIFY